MGLTVPFGSGVEQKCTDRFTKDTLRRLTISVDHASASVPRSVDEALDIAAAWVDDGRVPGVAACVVSSAGLVAERYHGVLSAGGDEPVGQDTRFALASLTKPLVAAAVLVAAEEGLVELDAPVRDGFTLRHLLSHASGLPVPSSGRDDRPDFTPGTRRRYSNAGYALTGRLLEQASEMPARDYLAAALLEHLDMDASLGLDEVDASRTATVREAGLDAPGEELFNGAAFRRKGPVAGGAFATARAYGTFLTCLLRRGAGDGGAVLAPETVDEMLACQFGELPGEVEGVGSWDLLCWGLGFDVRGTRRPHWTGDSLPPSASSHFGASGTVAWLDPTRDLGLVALANRGTYGGWWARAGGWGDLTSAVVAAAG
jgi:CubicO group peptidase (beta-lactamase class C family)